MTESEHTAEYHFPIFSENCGSQTFGSPEPSGSERRAYDDIMNKTYQGCIKTGACVRLLECGQCTLQRRATCQVPKKFIDRYGFGNYKEMLRA